MNHKPLLFASLLLDKVGSRTSRQLGKVQASSLLRFLFNGEIAIWRNFSDPLFVVGRKGLQELDFSPEVFQSENGDRRIQYRRSQFQMAESLREHSLRYSWIILAHEDAITLRNLDHLFAKASCDVLASKKNDGRLDEGFFAIRGNLYGRFLDARQVVDKDHKDQPFLESLIKQADLSVEHFERGEVVRPFEQGTGLSETMEAAVVHLTGGTPSEKVKVAFALHMMKTFGDKDGLFLDLLES